MKLLIYFSLIFMFLGILGIGHDTFVSKVFAQTGGVTIFATSSWCTKVGEATGPNPCPKIAPGTGKLPPGTTASCPIVGGKIGCGSYGPPLSSGGFYGSCRADGSGNGGHCNSIYQSDVKICLERERGGNLIRTAKSIDVSNNSKEGDPVYLPTIKGQSLKWFYRGTVSAGGGFGFIRVFQSERTAEGIYTIHFVHTNADSPALADNQKLSSGEVGATLFDMGDGYIHVHLSVGLNIAEPFDANDLQKYDPGWLFADRDLAMCAGG